MTTTSLNASPATRTPSVLRPAGLAVLLSAILSVILIARNTADARLRSRRAGARA